MTAHQATEEDVAACYRTFLGRDPESEEVMQAHLAARPGLWDLVAHVRAAAEAQRRSIEGACEAISAQQDSRAVVTEASDADLTLLTGHIRNVWSRYGREEAYYSVLTNPAYLSERLGVADIEAFFDTGRDEVDRFEEVCRRNRIEPDRSWSVTELGCGVGRVGEAFASRFASYLGVDISADHLAIARRRFADQALQNTTLCLLEDFLAGCSTPDVFFSVIVLQHNPPPIIHRLLDACLARVKPGGIAFFQVPCHLYEYAFSLTDYIAGKGRKETMEIHPLPQREVFALLARHGFTPIEVTPDDRIGPIGFSYTFLARKAS